MQAVKNVSARVNVKFQWANQSCSSSKIANELMFSGIIVISTIIFMNVRKTQFVFISGFSSELMSIKCGVSPGSTLGPFLFLLYISDLNLVFNKAITIHFAGDTHLSYTSKILSTFESVRNYELKKLPKLS